MDSTTRRVDKEDVEHWVRRHFGLTLARFSEAKVGQLLQWLSSTPRSDWDASAGDICNLLSIPETHFARHPECFELLREVLEGVEVRRPTGSVKLWSAGCATGEEAYQLAATGLDVVGRRVEVFGTDFSGVAIERARAGRYRRWSMRGREAKSLTWLRPVLTGGVEVDARVRSNVEFRVGNLLEPLFAPSSLDVVFCRNVLIYFCEEGVEKVLANIRDALRPGGVLVLAPTDPQFSLLSDMEAIPFRNPPVRCYREPGPVVRLKTPAEPWPGDLAASVRELLEV